MLEEWPTSWKNGDTGRKIYNIMPSVSLRPTNWIREDVIFFSQHGPFTAYLKRFHLPDSDYCSCGGIGTALHYATECIYTVFLTDMFNHTSQKLVKVLQEEARKDFVEILDPLMLCTFASMCETIFGTKIGALENINMQFSNSLDRFWDMITTYNLTVILPLIIAISPTSLDGNNPIPSYFRHTVLLSEGHSSF
ncbi:hypothetical protein AVEN_117907-1 [Araneus ventricosus]|uniref:Uncharacterized protein n=1 Tax=Araneus ventricosus TaxID=182803 RepID=A0A4Y2JAV0_ARAVE|nr:hypothetical protein AVEN_117907-1 [Araneus ventricosus]